MTNEEAITRIKDHMTVHRLHEPRAILITEALKIAISALAKQTPKRPKPIDWEQFKDKVDNAEFMRGGFWCPNCNHLIKSGDYCVDCGQALDWGEGEKE